MGGALHSQFTARAMALAACVAFLCVAAPARAETRTVVVAKFDGPKKSSKLMRKAVLEIVGDVYEVLPYRKYRVAGRRLGVEPDSVKACRQIARRVGADAIVEGEISKNKLTVRVREGRTGQVVDKFRVAVGSRGASERTREVLTDELVDLIDSTEPVSAGDASALDGGAEASTIADTRA